jgi:hypothetical protein
MRPRINPWWFFVKLVALLIVTYLLWAPLAPYYAQFLLRASQVGVWLTEFATDPQWQHPTQLLIKPEISPTALLFFDTRFTQAASGIPAEWVMANMVLLIPLMLATPARTWRERFGKLAVALSPEPVFEGTDIGVGDKGSYAQFPRRVGAVRDRAYHLDAFFQSWDRSLSVRDLGRGELPPGFARALIHCAGARAGAPR